MSASTDRVRDAQVKIAEILRHDWSRMALPTEAGVQNEFDTYVGGVYALLTMGPSAHQLAKYLSKMEANSVGFQRTDPELLIPVAEKLLAVDVPRRTLALKSPAKDVVQAIVTTVVAGILTLLAIERPLRLLSVLIVLGAVTLAGMSIYQAVDQVRHHGRRGPAA